MSGPMSEEVNRPMSTVDRVRELVVPIVEAAGLDLYDLELGGGTLQVLLDKDGGVGVDDLATV
ncbi:MAG: ribosome maturation factor RimP, partial [Actinomycetota bacterium]